MNTITALSAKEALEVIYNSDIEIYMKIPKKLICLLREISDKCEELVKLKENTSIIEQPISDEAKAILALIYKDFIADKEQREMLNKLYLEKQAEKFDTKELFNKNRVDNNSGESEEKALVEMKKEAWYERLFLILKKLFKIK